MALKKILFIDRDGTLIEEPSDFQIDSVEKFKLLPNTITSLLELKKMGFSFVMVTNQDGLGTKSNPQEKFDMIQKLLIEILESEGIVFEDTLICPHFPQDNCDCRKPKLGMVLGYMRRVDWDREKSYVIGDRATDVELAKNMGIKSFRLDRDTSWKTILGQLNELQRIGTCLRQTKETTINIEVNLDDPQRKVISTGLPFFDHMLDQIATHSNISLICQCQGDLEIDDHHTVEDIGLALGTALKQALGDKRGIGRFSFYLPMDDASCKMAIDLSGRPFFRFEGKFSRDEVGGLSTEMVPHFFRSLAESLGANIHISFDGENTHHQVESIFKAFGRCLRQSVSIVNAEMPSSKGSL